MRAFQMLRGRATIFALIVVPSGIATAQLGNASAAAAGLSGAFTARATGYNAVYWNPANLAMPGNPGFSFTLLAVDGFAGLRPIDLNRLAPYSGKEISQAVRSQWLADVVADSGQKGDLTGGVTELGLSIGSFALTVNTKASGNLNLAPDFVHAILFGNVDTTPQRNRQDLNLAGTTFRGAAYTTGALSFGLPMPRLIPLTNFAAGATVKYIVGHGLAYGEDFTSAIDTNVNISVPAIVTKADSANGIAGTGMGLDLGGAWTIPGFRFGVSLQNVVNTFKWDTTKLQTVSGVAVFRGDTTFTHSDTTTFSSAPASLRQKVVAQRFKPVFAAGVAFNWIPTMTVSADVRQQVGDGIEVGPQSLIAAGVEWRIIPFIPLRGGISAMTGGVGISGGFGIHALGYEAAVGGYLRKRNGGSEPGITVNLVSIRP
jgi:hypothetical protein